MKKTNITIQYDEEKLETLKVYLEDKKINLNDELCKHIDSLYNKLVPTAVRDFFSRKTGGSIPRKSSNNTRTQTSQHNEPKALN